MWPSVKLSGENERYLHENKKAICHIKILSIVPRFENKTLGNSETIY